MFPSQFKTGKGMVKIFHPFDLVKGYFRMAFRTILSEFIFMDIFMTTGAIPKRDPLKDLCLLAISYFNLMAKLTIHLGMFPEKFEMGVIMIESGGRSELVEVMTGGTVTGKSAQVIIGMTGKTFTVKTQVGRGFFPDLIIRDELTFVTILAVCCSMLAFQLVSCKGVVEMFLIKPDHFEISAVMVVMTACTFLAFYFG